MFSEPARIYFGCGTCPGASDFSFNVGSSIGSCFSQAILVAHFRSSAAYFGSSMVYFGEMQAVSPVPINTGSFVIVYGPSGLADVAVPYLSKRIDLSPNMVTS